MKKELQSIKRKNSKFRKFVGQAFQSLAQCFKPGQVHMPTYISSEEEDEEPADTKGKRPSMAHCMAREEGESDDEDEEEDSDEEENAEVGEEGDSSEVAEDSD